MNATLLWLSCSQCYSPRKRSGPETDLQPCPRRNSFIKLTKASTAFMVTAL